MAKLRIILLAAALIALPGTCLTEPLPPRNLEAGLEVTPLQAFGTSPIGELSWLGGWALESENYLYGGYSALMQRRDQTLLAASDQGRLLVLDV